MVSFTHLTNSQHFSLPNCLKCCTFSLSMSCRAFDVWTTDGSSLPIGCVMSCWMEEEFFCFLLLLTFLLLNFFRGIHFFRYIFAVVACVPLFKFFSTRLRYDNPTSSHKHTHTNVTCICSQLVWVYNDNSLNQHTRELISIWKMSHKHNNKDLSRLQ